MLCSKFQLLSCFTWLGCASPVPPSLRAWALLGRLRDWGVERSWGITAAPGGPWPEGTCMDITCLQGGIEEISDLTRSWRGFERVRDKVCVRFSPHLDAAQCHSIPRLRRSFPWSLAWLRSLRHTSTTRNICPSFMQSVSITNNYLSSSLFLLCWLLS